MKHIELIKDFEKKKYGFSGNASIQVCEWNRDAIRGKGHCYKQDFYGADTLSCHQISPTTFWCNNKCIFCWRPKEYMGSKPDRQTQNSNVKQMVNELIEKRKKLISGFKGGTKKAQKNFESALAQKHWAISLS
jgi:tRNA wybutosine-synthesizing protein 1